MHEGESRDGYYVYVYIDPRNFEEIYYGKGIRDRKDAHLSDDSETEKADRLKEIQAEGLTPIIRVVARGLSEKEAYLVEKTLIWKLGKNLLNKSSGSGGYAEKFRPDKSLHKRLEGFDFEAGVYYFNVGHGNTRRWSDCKSLGFISAGQGLLWRDAIKGFEEGDIFAAYLKGNGFVGIGRIIERARPIREIMIGGRALLDHCPWMDQNKDSNDLCEHVAIVEWVRAVDPSEAKWQAKSNIYTTTHVRASLARQANTIAFLNEQFKVDIEALMVPREVGTITGQANISN